MEIRIKNKHIDGSVAIALPIIDGKQNSLNIGKKELYIYSSEEGYNAVVYELTPDQNQMKKDYSFENLNFYNGYLSTLDLIKGIIKVARFTNGIAVNTMNVKIISKKNTISSVTHKEEVPIPLDEVVIYGHGGSYTTFAVRDFSVSNLFGMDNYSTNSYFISHNSGGGGAISISSSIDLKNNVNATKSEAFDIKLDIDPQRNQMIAKTSFNLLPWCGINVFVTQNIGDGEPNTIQAITTNTWGVTLGFSWSQDAYSVSVNGKLTTINITGTLTLNSGYNGIGNVYSSTKSFKIILDNRSGKILSGTRNP